MTTPTQQKLNNAYNEFIRDYVEAHGQNQATRDEAHERAGKLVAFAQDAVELCLKHGVADVNDWLDHANFYGNDDAYLVACAVAVALEEVK